MIVSECTGLLNSTTLLFTSYFVGGGLTASYSMDDGRQNELGIDGARVDD